MGVYIGMCVLFQILTTTHETLRGILDITWLCVSCTALA